MIKIDIKNTDGNRRKFATIALTVDREEFLVEVKKIRKKYKVDVERKCPHKIHNKGYFEGLLTKKLDNTELLKLWHTIEYNSLRGFIEDKDVYKPDPEHQGQQTILLLNKITGLRYKNNKTSGFCDDFAKTITSLRKKLNLSPQMERVIAHAILCNLVKAEDLQPAYAYVDFEEGSGGDYNRLKNFVMNVSLQATKKDVLEAYNRDIKPFQVPAYGVDTTVPLSTKDSIYTQRERFWKNKQGLGYKMIAADESGIAKYKRTKKEYKNLAKKPGKTQADRKEMERLSRYLNNIEASTSGVKRSVQRYKKLLDNTVQNLVNSK